MDFPNDEQLREALGVLTEVLAYLQRLPPVPTTLTFCRDLAAFLDAPTSRLVLNQESTRRGTSYSPAGVPLVHAELRGDMLTVCVASLSSARLLLTGDMTFQLKVVEA
ncbi:hypothetical protein [Achromobacter aloeverae]